MRRPADLHIGGGYQLGYENGYEEGYLAGERAAWDRAWAETSKPSSLLYDPDAVYAGPHETHDAPGPPAQPVQPAADHALGRRRAGAAEAVRSGDPAAHPGPARPGTDPQLSAPGDVPSVSYPARTAGSPPIPAGARPYRRR